MRLETRFGAGFKPFGNQVSSHFVFTERCVYIQGLLHREGPSHRDGFLQRDDFTKGCFYVRVLLRGDTFNTEMLLHTGALRYKYFYTEMILLTQAPLHRDAFTQVFSHVNTSTVHGVLRTHSFTLRFLYTKALLHRGILTHTHTQWQSRLHANTFTRRCSFCARFLYMHASSVTGMPLITHAFTQRYFYTETPSHREKCLFTHKYFYREMILHWAIFTQKPKQTEVLLQRNACARRVFSYGHFHTDILLNYFLWRTRVWRKEFGKHMQNHSFTTAFDGRDAFVGKGWPRTNPHCNLTSMHDDRHFVRTGCVSWTSIHVALPLEEKS